MSAAVLAPLSMFAATARQWLPPAVVTVEVTDPAAVSNPAALWRNSHRVGVELHPGVVAAWLAAGGRRNGGTFTFSRSRTDLAAVFTAAHAGCWDVAGSQGGSRAARVAGLADKLPEFAAVVNPQPGGRPSPGVTLRVQLTARTVKVTFTHVPLEFGPVVVPRAGATVDVDHHRAAAALVAARALRWPTADRGAPPRYGAAAALASASVAVLPAPSAPGLARLVVGAAAADDLAATGGDADPGAAAATAALEAYAPATTLAAGAAADAAVAVDGWVPLHVEASVDAAADAADPVPVQVAGLAEHQARFVGSYVASQFGALCALRPGAGKTVCAAAAFAQRCGATNGRYRALIVAPSATLRQWRAELATWFPASTTVTATTATALADVRRQLAGTGGALCVLSTPAALAANPGTFDGVVFDDVCVDEAKWLKNLASGRSAELWRIRSSAGHALGLWGTPSEGSADDIAALVAWAVGDRHLFDEVPLSARAATWDCAGPDGFTLADVCGAAVFTADTTVAPEGIGAIPPLQVEVSHLDPSPFDVAASDACWALLADAQSELETATAAALAAPGRSPAGRAARRVAATARSRAAAVLRFARVAGSAAAVARTSSLSGSDVVADAWAGSESTKLTWVVGAVADLVCAGEQVLVFTDSDAAAVTCAERFAAAGVPAVSLTSRRTSVQRDRDVSAFAAGTARAALVGPSSQLGVNLTTASTVVHLDLGVSGAVGALVQRCARAARLGSAATHVRVLVPVLRGTLDEAVGAALLEQFAAVAGNPGTDLGITEALSVPDLLAART